jgi:small subunit ribosomal protein S11
MAKEEKEKKPQAAKEAPKEAPAKEGGAKEGAVAVAPAKEGPAKEAREGGKEGKDVKVKVKKQKRNVPRAIAHIKSTFNNTIVTITDLNGDTLCWDSAGSMGFKGSRKGTPFAAQRAGENAADKAKKMGVREVECRVQGPGAGRDSACRALQGSGIEIKSIEDVTPLPHNGCRPKKRRRV